MAYESLGDIHKAARVAACAGWLAFEPPTDSSPMRLTKAEFCRVRLCPMCQWRRSLKIFAQASQIIAAANASRQGGYAWVMLTLTQRSVDAAALPAELTRISKAWQRLTQRNAFKKAVKGSMRCVEITHGKAGYHPHIHALLAVNPSYFKHSSYLPRAEWAALWQQAARLDYVPQVWVSKSYGDKAAKIAEVAKYAAKPEEYINPSDWDYTMSTVATLDAACAKRRFLSYGGILKDIKTKLGLEDAESDTVDLVHTGDTGTPEVSDDMAGKLLFEWSSGYRNYYRAK